MVEHLDELKFKAGEIVARRIAALFKRIERIGDVMAIKLVVPRRLRTIGCNLRQQAHQPGRIDELPIHVGSVERGTRPIHLQQFVHERRCLRRIMAAPVGIHLLPVSPLETLGQLANVLPSVVVERRTAQQANARIFIGP